ncbi:transposase [Thorsellia anophelis]|uniref:Transposase and inactivated derivatives n=1 Tax=Thorsellia anophelis DSM 18579 TaxID=1123402 RepID=A0A1I0F9T6_9GAMM|nr:transposase [Thorsellia anophelis]SET54690.1 hypothetical protein SAMN02583745_02694 [Thorsellia anophelis DSM 18579]
MSKFTVEFKETILTKLLDGDYTSITALAQHYNISTSTLYKWQAEIKSGSNDNIMKNKKVHKNTSNKTKSSIPVNKLTEAQKKLNIIIATSTLNEAELARYCRENGYDIAMVKSLLSECVEALAMKEMNVIAESHKLAEKDKEISHYKKELDRKDRALSETAALLVLSKKAKAIWGETQED